jgi:hypothetical protein
MAHQYGRTRRAVVGSVGLYAGLGAQLGVLAEGVEFEAGRDEHEAGASERAEAGQVDHVRGWGRREAARVVPRCWPRARRAGRRAAGGSRGAASMNPRPANGSAAYPTRPVRRAGSPRMPISDRVSRSSLPVTACSAAQTTSRGAAICVVCRSRWRNSGRTSSGAEVMPVLSVGVCCATRQRPGAPRRGAAAGPSAHTAG